MLPIFQTPRLTARSWQPGDGPLLNAAILDSLKELQPIMPRATPTPTIADSESYAQRSHQQFQSNHAYAFALFLTSPNSPLICTLSITPAIATLRQIVGPGDWYEIGYWCRTPYTRQGYMTEALQESLRWAMREVGLAWFVLRIAETNLPSRRIADRLGFIQAQPHSTSAPSTQLIYQRRFLK